jgi:hypothetical protein
MSAINVQRIRRVLVSLAAICVIIGTWTFARSDSAVSAMPTLQLGSGQPGDVFDPGAVGLSTEAFELSSGHLSAEHERLVRLMRMLGPSVLRIGGNSLDLSWWTSNGEPPPAWASNTVTPVDLATLSGLLDATGWRVLLGVDLGHFEPARAADEARFAKKILGTGLLGIEIGNEPDDFGRKVKLRAPTYSLGEYLQEAEAYRQALSAVGVSVFGPALGRTEWLTQMGAAARMFSELTLHYYPTSTCADLGSATASQASGTELLLPDVRLQEEETIQALVHAGSIAARPTRVGETNTAACPTSPSAGPVFPSALWALDWSLRAASHGVSGMNFHSDLNECGSHSESPICAFNEQAAHAGDVTAQPEFYGLLAASQLEGGRFIPARLTTSDSLPNLTIWATLASNGTVKVAIDNLATEGLPQSVAIPASGYTVTAEALVGPPSKRGSGVTLGRAAITADGLWHPRSRPVPAVKGSARVIVPAVSAVIVTLRPGSRRRVKS